MDTLISSLPDESLALIKQSSHYLIIHRQSGCCLRVFLDLDIAVGCFRAVVACGFDWSQPYEQLRRDGKVRFAVESICNKYTWLDYEKHPKQYRFTTCK